MQLKQAVAILNQKRHRNTKDWRVFGLSNGYPIAISEHTVFTEFEAIAIAEAYLRLPTPAGRSYER